MEEKQYCVYTLSNVRRTILYTGVTGDLAAGIDAHKTKAVKGFAPRYNVDRLVYVEVHGTAYDAITREKKIKGGSRARKIALIEAVNPDWKDLPATL